MSRRSATKPAIARSIIFLTVCRGRFIRNVTWRPKRFLKKRLSPRCEVGAAGRCKARSPAADHVRRRSAVRTDEPAAAMLGVARRPAQGRFAAHSRIHLSLWRCCSEGGHLRLLDHADLRYGVLSGLPGRAVTQIRQAGYIAGAR